MANLGVYDRRQVLKVDDTTVGIMEGHYAGVWTAGVSLYGNYTKEATF